MLAYSAPDIENGLPANSLPWDVYGWHNYQPPDECLNRKAHWPR